MIMKSNKLNLKIMIIAIMLVIFCAVIGAIKPKESTYETRSIKSKIDIGGYGLFVNCYGKGSPTVVFESGLGSSYSDWNKVQPQIAKITRTFSYDRAGIMRSDASKIIRTSLNQVYELHILLKNSKVKGPYIIVAHSIGGYNARLFAGTYPKEVAGIVFVDCTHENQSGDIANLTEQQYKEAATQFKGAEQNLDEFLLSTKQVKEIRKKDALRNMPIIVITADHNYSEDQYKPWISFQKDIASLSNKSKYIFVKNSGHYVQMQHSQIVIDAIKEIISKVKR